MWRTLYEFCRKYGRERFLAEWDAERNAPLTPMDVEISSSHAFWWRCAQGHVDQATIRARLKDGCSVCAWKTYMARDNAKAR